jgi:hypothetical protein
MSFNALNKIWTTPDILYHYVEELLTEWRNIFV